MSFTDEEIGRIAHEAIRALQTVLNDPANPVSAPWDSTSQENRDLTVANVQVGRHGVSPEILHERWMDEKLAAGWVLGDIKDPEAKTHPALVPFGELLPGEQAKDILFAGVCVAMNRAADVKAKVENEERARADAARATNALGIPAQAARMPFGGAQPIIVQAAQEPGRPDGE